MPIDAVSQSVAVRSAAATFADVTLHLGGRAVFSHLSLEIVANLSTVVMGPNGAGKTSLSRLLIGTLAPTAGAITRAPGTRIAFVPQSVALYPFLTVRENVFASGYGEGLRGRLLAERIESALETALCADVARRRVGELSGGYQKRAAIAAAAVGHPNLLVLDEPTAGLDMEAGREIASALRAVQANGATLVVTTHDFDFADTLADRVLFLRDGAIAAGGAPAAMVQDLYGGAQRIDLLLAKPAPSRDNRSRLSLYRELGRDGTAPLMRDLEAEGIAVTELRLRNPGIATLYERFCAAAVDDL